MDARGAARVHNYRHAAPTNAFHLAAGRPTRVVALWQLNQVQVRRRSPRASGRHAARVECMALDWHEPGAAKTARGFVPMLARCASGGGAAK